MPDENERDDEEQDDLVKDILSKFFQQPERPEPEAD